MADVVDPVSSLLRNMVEKGGEIIDEELVPGPIPEGWVGGA